MKLSPLKLLVQELRKTKATVKEEVVVSVSELIDRMAGTKNTECGGCKGRPTPAK